MKIPEERKIENLTVKEISYIEVIKEFQNTKTKKSSYPTYHNYEI